MSGGRFQGRYVFLLDLVVTATAVQLFLDVRVLNAVAPIQHVALVALLRSMPGQTETFGLLCTFGLAITLLWRAHSADTVIPNRLVFIFVTSIVSLTTADILKGVFGRARPTLLLADGTYGYHILGGAQGFDSFPSSHSAIAFGLATALSVLWPENRRIVFGIAVVVAISRVIAEYHYPSDAVAGCLVGIATTWIVHWTFQRNGFRLAQDDNG